jgi:hypothetical protein
MLGFLEIPKYMNTFENSDFKFLVTLSHGASILYPLLTCSERTDDVFEIRRRNPYQSRMLVRNEGVNIKYIF